MSEVIGKGVIEVSADATKLKAGVDDAKRSIKSLGKDIGDSVSAGSARASRSIDNYVKKLQTAANTSGMSARESELYTLSLKGASKAQLEAADSALKMSENYQKGVDVGQRLRTGFIALAAAAGAAAAATYAGTIALIAQVGNYQDLAEKIGDTAVNISSLKTASDVSGTSLDTIATASVKLTAALSKTDDESKSVGAAINALGINFDKFKKQSPVEQLQTVARAFGEFADGSEKTAVAVSLFGKSGAELLGFLKEYADEGLNAAYVTAEQAKAADDYSDAQARLKSQLEQFLQVTAVNTVPILTQVGDLFRSIGKEQQGAGDATGIIKSAISGLVVIFQTLVVIGSDVVFVFKGVGREIGAIAAQLAALANLDFQGFSAISDAVKDDAQRARAQLDAFQARVMAIGQESKKFVDPRILGSTGSIADQAAALRPKLNTSGLNQDKEKKGDSAAEEAKRQLAFDLERIKIAGASITDSFSNSEKVFEAMRSAGLVDERDYFAQKIAFLTANEAAQVSALKAEKERLEQESLSGKDKIDNDRKIADVEAKLAKVRRAAAADTEVLSIQQAAAIKQVDASYLSATQAAKEYFDTTAKQQAREISDIGAGPAKRDFNQGVTQIEDRYSSQRRDLQNNRAVLELEGKFTAQSQVEYDKRLSIIDEFQRKSLDQWTKHYADLKTAQGDWANGMSEGLRTYFDETQNLSKQTSDAVGSAFKGMEDSIIEFAKTGKLSVKGLVDSILTDIARIVIRQQITGPLAGLLGGLFGGGGATGGAGITSVMGLAAPVWGARALGGPVSASGVYRVNENGPEMLTAGGKDYLMMGSQGGSVNPNAGGGAPVTVIQNFTVGDVASISMVKQAVAGSEARIVGGLRRSRSYAGEAS